MATSDRSTAARRTRSGKRGQAPRDPIAAVRHIAAQLPEAEEVESRGNPDFRVRGKTFASYVVNHHGDGRVAVWLPMPDGSQSFYVENEPEHYFRPPYLGGKGWLGVQLDSGLRWSTIAERVRTAYETVAPRSLLSDLRTPEAIAPSGPVDPLDFDPLTVAKHKAKLEKLRARCLALPEVGEDLRFGDPVWRAGKKTFATAYGHKRRVYFSFWVGSDRQPIYTLDKTIHVPPYTGGQGWISVDVTGTVRWSLVDELLDLSYRHFALKRMLKALDAA